MSFASPSPSQLFLQWWPLDVARNADLAAWIGCKEPSVSQRKIKPCRAGSRKLLHLSVTLLWALHSLGGWDGRCWEILDRTFLPGSSPALTPSCSELLHLQHQERHIHPCSPGDSPVGTPLQLGQLSHCFLGNFHNTQSLTANCTAP